MMVFIPRWSIQVTGKSQKRDVIAYQIRQSFKLLRHNGEYYNLAEYSREVFRMFGTDEAVEVELLCKNYIMNAVIDLLPMGIRLGRGYEDPRSGEREGEI